MHDDHVLELLLCEFVPAVLLMHTAGAGLGVDADEGPRLLRRVAAMKNAAEAIDNFCNNCHYRATI